MRTLGTKDSWFGLAVVLGLAGVLTTGVAAQTTVGPAPTLIPVSGQFLTAEGQPRAGAGVTLVISLYEGKDDPAPRWIETQNVVLDPQGRYDVRFGATLDGGLPADLFAGVTGTRWVGVAVLNEAEQPRVMLVSVPYAAKAVEAETLAGRSASDFVLASTFRDDLKTALADQGVRTTADDEGGIGTAAVTQNYLQKGDGSGSVTDSALFEAGGYLGFGTATPYAKIHVTDAFNPNIFLHYTGTPSPGIKGGIAFLHNRGGDGAIEELGRIEGIAESAFSAGGFRFVARNNQDIEVLRVNSAGNMAVGTDNPGPFRLFVNTAADTIARFRTNNSGGLSFDFSNFGGVLRMSGSTNLAFGTLGSERMRIDGNGNVGIGTGAPNARLHVAGDAMVSGNMIVDGNIGAKYQDVAEWVDAAEPLEPGTLVVIDTAATNRVHAAKTSYDSRVAGAVSPQPGLILGEPGEGRVLVAQSGRVKVKADARFGAIRPGDLLVSSPTKGHVMRSKPVKVGEAIVHRPGTVVGKALEALPKGQGEILVLLTLQ